MAATSVEDFEVFKLAHALVLKVYETTRTFPREETFGLVTQLRRAATPVVANLVEGAGRLNRAEYRQFAGIARASAAETSYELLLAGDLGYIARDDSDRLREDYGRVAQMLTASLRPCGETIGARARVRAGLLVCNEHEHGHVSRCRMSRLWRPAAVCGDH